MVIKREKNIKSKQKEEENMEFDLGCESESMVHDGESVLAVPTVDLDASTAAAQDERVHFLRRLALELVAREVCVV